MRRSLEQWVPLSINICQRVDYWTVVYKVVGFRRFAQLSGREGGPATLIIYSFDEKVDIIAAPSRIKSIVRAKKVERVISNLIFRGDGLAQISSYGKLNFR